MWHFKDISNSNETKRVILSRAEISCYIAERLSNVTILQRQKLILMIIGSCGFIRLNRNVTLVKIIRLLCGALSPNCIAVYMKPAWQYTLYLLSYFQSVSTMRLYVVEEIKVARIWNKYCELLYARLSNKYLAHHDSSNVVVRLYVWFNIHWLAFTELTVNKFERLSLLVWIRQPILNSHASIINYISFVPSNS